MALDLEQVLGSFLFQYFFDVAAKEVLGDPTLRTNQMMMVSSVAQLVVEATIF